MLRGHIELGIVVSFAFKLQAKKKFFTTYNRLEPLSSQKNLCFELGFGGYFQIVAFINIDGLK